MSENVNQAEKREPLVYINVNNAFLKKVAYTDHEGVDREFTRVSIPNGTVIGGQEVRLASFIAGLMYPNKKNPERITDLAFKPGEPVKVNVPVLGDDGRVVTDADGRWESIVIETSPQDLKQALKEQFDRYRAEHPIDREQVAENKRGPADLEGALENAAAARTAESAVPTQDRGREERSK